jgi:phosphoenolpyruvate---glycerone phosphotransferase subunit DhaL
VSTFSNAAGSRIVEGVIATIQENKQYLSDLDGLIGDGDHGVNMNKGMTMTADQLAENPGDLHHSLKTLFGVLMESIGGSMGPIYGQFFRGMAKACKGIETIDAEVVGNMLRGARESIQKISEATVGDKTMMDTLIPAEEAYAKTVAGGGGLTEALDAMVKAARAGRDSTKDMVSRIGRSSRLGERSRGVLDTGSVSCCLILESISTSIKSLIA